MPAKQNETDLEPLLTAQQLQLDLVMDESASIDNKALGLLAVAVAVLIFMAQADLAIERWWHGVVIFGPYILALLCIGFAIWPRRYQGASPDIDKYPENLKLSRNELLLQLLVNTSAVQQTQQPAQFYPLAVVRNSACAFACRRNDFVCYTMSMKSGAKKTSPKKKTVAHSAATEHFVLPKPQKHMEILKGL